MSNIIIIYISQWAVSLIFQIVVVSLFFFLIFGDYYISTTTEYRSYATDFDGEALGVPGSVFVSISDGSVVSLDGRTLHIFGGG